jgi:hypothetical protein
MKALKPVALAVSFALASAAAHAQLAAPQFGTSPPTQTTTDYPLVLAIWNPTTLDGEQVNLGYLYSQLTTASGNLTPASAADPLAANFATAVNPATLSGSVLQLNFGTVPGFSSTFGTGAGAQYMVVAENGSGLTKAEMTYSGTLASLQAALPIAGLDLVANDINGQNWSGTLGYTIDTSGTGANNPLNGTMNGGSMDSIYFGGAINSALGFFNGVPNGRTADTITQYQNATGAGFWFLSSSGDLTWNVPLASAAVPLPAAAWLMLSGLAGLGAISRRRRPVATPAAA